MTLTFSMSEAIAGNATFWTKPYVVHFLNLSTLAFFDQNSKTTLLPFTIHAGIYSKRLYNFNGYKINISRLIWTLIYINSRKNISFKNPNNWSSYLYSVLKSLDSCIEFVHPDESFTKILDIELTSYLYTSIFDQVTVVAPNFYYPALNLFTSNYKNLPL